MTTGADDRGTPRPSDDLPPLTGGYASPPCYATEIAPDYFDPLAVDPQQARDVARWRKAERTRLLTERMALPVADRTAASEALAEHLGSLLRGRSGGARGKTLAAYWPIKGEPDLRPLMAEIHEAGATVALPLVETRAAPLGFRRWIPKTRMARGNWNIPVPPRDTPAVTPSVILIPLVGWSGDGFRLGHGGGYFDRTLAALRPRPFAIGVGFEAAHLKTIFPQPHDIPMDIIVTEAGIRFERTDG